MKALAVEFGLTPSARAKIVIPNRKDPKTNVGVEFAYNMIRQWMLDYCDDVVNDEVVACQKHKQAL